MLYLYRIIINFVFLLSPIVLVARIFNKKEHKYRFKEKLGSIVIKRKPGKLIWFHASSVGELLSIIPLIEKLEKIQQIKTILVTTNTLSSSRVFKKKKYLNKTIHQFLPIDTNNLSLKFLNYWKPSIAIFVESEIWPNFIFNIKKFNIPLLLINGRFTQKTFKSWKKIPLFAEKIFKKFDLCLVQNKESKKFLKYFKAKKIKEHGNLKFSKSNHKAYKTNKKELSNLFRGKKIWCASSTHDNEEIICAEVHNKLKVKIKNLVTIIIPRHINRIDTIINQIKLKNLNVAIHSKKNFNYKKTDIYLVDTYGEVEKFYDISEFVFLGGSLINHGGQNPIEPSRYGCKIFHGPHIQNFREVYSFLHKLKISKKIKNGADLYKSILQKNDNLLRKKFILNNKLDIIGKKILSETFLEIKSFIN